jgi:hypothetical protein
VQHDVTKRLDQKYSRHQQHESEQHFVRARGELDSLHRHQGDEANSDRRQQGKRNLRHHAVDCEHCVKRVLNRLEQILKKHCPSENEPDMRIQRLADV